MIVMWLSFADIFPGGGAPDRRRLRDRALGRPLRPRLLGDRSGRPDMSGLSLAALSGADVFGLVASVLVCRLPALRAAARGEALMAQGWLQIAVFVGVVIALTPPLGAYMARVFTGQRVFLSPVLGPVERLTYRVLRVDPGAEQDWKDYAKSLLLFSVFSWVVLYLILRTQGIQPFNPEGFHSGPWDVSFNTASSFVSNTNWQYYGGETTLTYFAQMAGLTVQNFVTPAVGVCVAARAGPRHRRSHRRRARQLLAGPDPRPLLRAAAALGDRRAGPRLPGRGPDPRRRRRSRRHSRAPSRPSPSARPPRRSRSSSSAPTAAASSTSTRRCRSRTRTR